MLMNPTKTNYKRPDEKKQQTLLQLLHIDFLLFFFVLFVAVAGLFILYSTSGQDLRVVYMQIAHLLLATVLMLGLAQISPTTLQRIAPWLYLIGLVLLFLVALVGHIGKGGQRWLNLGIMNFQPSELMKLAIPMALAWYYHQIHLPIKLKHTLIALPVILIPAILTAKQPDLGTAILMFIAGASVLFFAGLGFRIIIVTMASACALAPFAWIFLHDYQRQRILTFLNPERDPLGKGYHIIQSMIAIGSGGIFGKGWLNGTQSSLQFLPEHSTDFIFAVAGEEFGFIGCILLIALYFLIVARGLYITLKAQDTFSRLLAGAITFTFFVSFFINMGMVAGILPVVGIPLPLISYGGSSKVTFMAGLGMLMSIQTHRKLVTT